VGCTPLNTRFLRAGFASEAGASTSSDVDRTVVVAARANLGVVITDGVDMARVVETAVGDVRTVPARARALVDGHARAARATILLSMVP
jgi:hypothetical protein